MSHDYSVIPESFSMLSQILNSGEMSQHLTGNQSVNVLELLADFAERSTDAVIAVLNSINFTSLKRISFKAQKNHRSSLLRLWTSIAAFDFHVHEDYMQNLFIFLVSFLASDADPVPTSDDLCRVLYLLVIACHENDLSRAKCKENGIPLLVKNYLKSHNWKLRCLCCILLSQLCYERNELKEYIFYDAATSDLLLLLNDSHPEVRAASLLLLQSFIGFSSNDPVLAAANLHVYLCREDVEALVHSKDPSVKRDQTILESITKYISMKSECSVMVRRELFRLMLKVFSRRCHMAHLICFVDRIIKNELDVSTILEKLNPSNPRFDDHDSSLFYVKYWIILLSIREAEPNAAIRKAASHYVSIICKNVDNLKNKGPLPTTPSIFDFSTLLHLNQSSQRSSLQHQSSLAALPTLPSPRASHPDAPPTDISSLPLLSTSHVARHASSSHTFALPTGNSGNNGGNNGGNNDGNGGNGGNNDGNGGNGGNNGGAVRSSQVSILPPNATSTLVSTSHDSIFGNTHIMQSPPQHAAKPALSPLPPFIPTTPSFSNLQLTTQPVSTSEKITHLDAWLEVQLGLLGLPSTYVEWFINNFVKTKADEASSCEDVETPHVAGVAETSRWCANSAKEYMQRRVLIQRRVVKPLVQRDVFHTNGSKIGSISFHPYFSAIAVGVRRGRES